jgi:hypothetical protein
LKKLIDEFLAAVFSRKSFWMTMVLSALGMQIECDLPDFVRNIHYHIEAQKQVKEEKAEKNKQKKAAKQAAAGPPSPVSKRKRVRSESDSD